MTKVITYGTYDLLHYGHIRLLERAKALGDYLIVAVTADDFDKTRGKINVQQSLMERIEGVRATGIADEIIVEEYEGQKIDDVRKYGIDIFTVGSDWIGKFDYMKDYCKVVYLDRTEGVSSSEIRAEKKKLKLGLVGNSPILVKVANESQYVNGIEISGINADNVITVEKVGTENVSFDELCNISDALYILSNPEKHFKQIKYALNNKKHVIYESPMCQSKEDAVELIELARKNKCLLMEGLKTAYSTAFQRLLLMAKTGKIGQVVSVDAICTSLSEENDPEWNSVYAWGPTALLPVYSLLGTDTTNQRIATHISEKGKELFTKISIEYPHAVGSVKVGQGVKSEGELIISGTKGYIYVPAPWWKTDYFEIRYENTNENKKFFYQLDGEGIRYELVVFAKAIESGRLFSNVSEGVSLKICETMGDYINKKNLVEI